MPDVGQRVILRPWAQGGKGPQMTQMNADKKTNHGNIFEQNGRRNEPTGRPSPFHLRPSASSADKNSEVSVSLTMIVRDEEANLPHCLSSVSGLFDEIVVVDTGSTDRTREIAREFGARVFDFVWVNDFAAARNAALARAKGDYAFWLDADDVLDPPTASEAPGAARWFAGRRRGRLCGPLLVRSGAEWRRRADGGGPYPAVSGAGGRALDVRRARADLAGAAAGECAGALDQPHCAAHRLHRPGAAGTQAPAGLQDPRCRASRAA